MKYYFIKAESKRKARGKDFKLINDTKEDLIIKVNLNTLKMESITISNFREMVFKREVYDKKLRDILSLKVYKRPGENRYDITASDELDIEFEDLHQEFVRFDNKYLALKNFKELNPTLVRIIGILNNSDILNINDQDYSKIAIKLQYIIDEYSNKETLVHAINMVSGIYQERLKMYTHILSTSEGLEEMKELGIGTFKEKYLNGVDRALDQLTETLLKQEI